MDPLAALRTAHAAAQQRIAEGQPGCFGRYFPLRADLARLERLDPAAAAVAWSEAEAAYRAIAAAGKAEISWLLLHQAVRLDSGAARSHVPPMDKTITDPPPPPKPELPPEVGGPKGPEPTRFGDWEQKGRCTDF